MESNGVVICGQCHKPYKSSESLIRHYQKKHEMIISESPFEKRGVSSALEKSNNLHRTLSGIKLKSPKNSKEKEEDLIKK
jgi:hypothetical protein